MSNRFASVDAAWLHMDRLTNLMVITSVSLFDRPVGLGAGQEDPRKAGVLERYPRFHQRVVESRLPLRAPKWEEDPRTSPSISTCTTIALPAPGDERALQELPRRSDDDAARPQPPAVAHLHGRWVRRWRGDDQPDPPLHRATALSLARVMLSLTDSEPDAGIELPEAEHRAPAAEVGVPGLAAFGVRFLTGAGRVGSAAVRQGVAGGRCRPHMLRALRARSCATAAPRCGC